MALPRRAWARGSGIVIGYALLSAWITWPLVTRAGTSIAGDFGDPVFVAWVMAWVADHLTAMLGGDLGAWAAMWNAPIFAPETSTLAYSDHFLAQSLLVLPVWWATGNPIGGYNVVYLATMTLTAVAAHGLTARLSGRQLAGVIAAILCTLNGYRMFWALSHLQILSICWWLFGLWGLEVFIATGSRRALAGAKASLVMLHLASSYLMAYCAPFTAAFAVWSMARHRRLRDAGAWAGVVGGGVVSIVAVLPLVLRYLSVSADLGFERSLEETSANSATFAAYGAAMPWIAPLVLLALAGALAPAAAAVGLTRRARWGLFAFAIVAGVLAMGPAIRWDGDVYTGPYLLLRQLVPGFEGLRVPHRFVAIAATLLAVLGGIGAAWLARWRLALIPVAVAVALVTRTGWQPPFPIDGALPSDTLATTPAYLRPSAALPRIYQFVATTPPESVVAELPFGDLGYEIRYTFFTAAHRRRLLNGYSGVLPPSYEARRTVLAAPLAAPDVSWAALSPATHVLVHADAWRDDTGAQVRAWLETRGARVVATVDGAWLYALPPR